MNAATGAEADALPEALLLTCLDFRLPRLIARYMAGRGLADRYNHVILAGASLGAVTDAYPAWGTTFRQHLELSIEVHRISRVIVLDHRDCRAYERILGSEHCGDRLREAEAHARRLVDLRVAIHSSYPALDVELLLMSLDGSVEQIA